MLTRPQKKLLLIASLGGVLEFYDFIIYAMCAGYLAVEFFPGHSQVAGLLVTFATFAVGYLVRPLGGIVFGHFGDKYGRKKTFTISILLMALATLGIAFVPNYATIGLAAPLLLTLLRIVQGLSVGGEIPGAIAYISESLPEHKGLACGWVFGFLTLGIVFASFVQALLLTFLDKPELLAWGWRVPFVLGGVFGLFSYRLRRGLAEPALFLAAQRQAKTVPLLHVLRYFATNALAGIGIVALGAALISLLFLFVPTYISELLRQEATAFVWLKSVAIILVAVLCGAFGHLADQYNNKKMLWLLASLTVGCAYFIFIIYAHYYPAFWLALLLSAGLTGFAWGLIPNMLTELFPTEIRYSGIAVSYNIGFAVFGGLTPFFATLLIYVTGSLLAPALYLCCTAILAIIALHFAKFTWVGQTEPQL